MKQPITFTHRVSPNATGIKISLDRSGGICVTSPKFTPTFLINAFVKQQEPWIRAQQEKLALLPRQNTPTTVVIFDQPYQKKSTLRELTAIWNCHSGQNTVLQPTITSGY